MSPTPQFIVRAFLLCVFGPACNTAFAATAIIAESGDAPSRGAGVLFLLEAPALSDNGQAAFESTRYTTNGFLVGGGIFRGNGQSDPRFLEPIVLHGDATPDVNGYFETGRSVTGFFISGRGQVAFAAYLEGTLGGSSDHMGIFRGDGGALTQIARGNELFPEGSGRLRSYFIHPISINDNGQVAFIAWLYNPAAEAIYRGDGTNQIKIVRTGDAAPREGVFSSLLYRCAMNESGQVLFAGTVNPGDRLGDRGGFWRGDGTNVVEIAYKGDATPGGNGTLPDVRSIPMAFNDQGKAAFAVTMFDTALGAVDNEAIFCGDEHGLVQIARKGAFVPGGNGRFLALNTRQALNNAGQVLFTATVSGATNGAVAGLFLGNGQSTIALARIHDPAPGGGRFSGFHQVYYDLNNAGQAAFYATIDLENGGTTSDRAGLFFYDPALGLLSVAREGDSLADLGLITAIQFRSSLLTGTGTETSGLNDHGQVAYQCTVGGNHAIALWSPPEPLSLDIRYDPSAEALILTWPASAEGYVLRYATALPAFNWTDIQTTPALTGDRFVVTNAILGGSRFFQLQKP